VGTDTITLAGFTLKTAVVEAGTVTNDDGLGFEGLSGLMGFAWSNIAVSQLPTFAEQLVNASMLANNVFSFHLGRGFDSLSAKQVASSQNGTLSSGSLTIGGTDSSTVRLSPSPEPDFMLIPPRRQFTGDVTFNPINEEAFWSMTADGMSVNSQLLSSTSGFQAIVSLLPFGGSHIV
jgi:hypothetical protein